jgi:hypothetical protein
MSNKNGHSKTDPKNEPPFKDVSKSKATNELSVKDISKPIHFPATTPYSPNLEPLHDPSVILTSPTATLQRRLEPGTNT